MARSARKTSLETRTARLRLQIRRAPHFVKIACPSSEILR